MSDFTYPSDQSREELIDPHFDYDDGEHRMFSELYSVRDQDDDSPYGNGDIEGF